MNLLEYKFPESAQDTAPELLDEAKERGFYNGRTPYNTIFSSLFFQGGVLHYKDGLPEPFRERATMYLKSIMGSFAPKHEHKEAVCALILSELVDIKAYEQ